MTYWQPKVLIKLLYSRPLGFSCSPNSICIIITPSKHVTGNVKVFCRVRPLFEEEGPDIVEFPDDNTLRINTEDESLSNPKKDFEFDRVYGPHVGQGGILFTSLASAVWMNCTNLWASFMQPISLLIFSPLFSQHLMDLMFLYFRMGRPHQERHILWYGFSISSPSCSTLHTILIHYC